MAKARTPRERWIEEGWRALAAGGPDAVRVEVLAAALGVTKGGFYWQFGDRARFLDAMLDAWERTVSDDVIARIEADGGDARDRLADLFDIVAGHPELQPLDLAIRDWARRDPAVAERLARVDARRMDYLRALFGELCDDPDQVEARSRALFSVYVARPLIAVEPEPGRERAVRDAFLALLTS